MTKLALYFPGEGISVINDPTRFAGKNISDMISFLLPYIFILAGLIMGIFLIMGGFELMTSAGSPEKIRKAQGKIVSALVGFLIIFLSYWIAEFLQAVLGINILK